jgi:hypothetical protein
MSRYRALLARRFSDTRRELAISEWVRFRLARNEALSTLCHGDPSAATLAGARAVQAAARSHLLWTGSPYPPDKWLLAVVAERGGGEVVAAAKTILDGTRDPGDRFAATHVLAGALETTMSESGADWDELGDWWRHV